MIEDAKQIWRTASDVTIVRGGALGDFVVTLPSLRAIARSGRRLHFIGNAAVARSLCDDLFASISSIDDPNFAGLFDPDSTRVMPFAGAAIVLMHDDAVARTLTNRGANPVIFAQPHPDPASARSMAGHLYDATLRAHDESTSTYFITRRMTARDLAPVESICMFGARTELRIEPTSWRDPLLQFGSPRSESASVQGLTHGSAPVAIIHPGSGSARKNWPLDRFQKIGAWLSAQGFRVLYLVGPADDNMAKRLEADVPESALVRDLPLRALANVLSAARLFIGNDSGTSHLAAALGTPTIAIFGPTRVIRWGPIGGIVACVEPEHRCELCRKAESRPVDCRCLDQITTTSVEVTIARLLSHSLDV